MGVRRGLAGPRNGVGWGRDWLDRSGELQGGEQGWRAVGLILAVWGGVLPEIGVDAADTRTKRSVGEPRGGWPRLSGDSTVSSVDAQSALEPMWTRHHGTGWLRSAGESVIEHKVFVFAEPLPRFRIWRRLVHEPLLTPIPSTCTSTCSSLRARQDCQGPERR